MAEVTSECPICGADVVDNRAEHQLMGGGTVVDVMQQPCANGHTVDEMNAARAQRP